MIQGFISSHLISSSDVKEMLKQESQQLDRRSARMSMAQNPSDNPLNLVRLTVKFPQFSGNIDIQNENMKQLLATNYSQQIQQMQVLPSLDVCEQYKNLSYQVKQTYSSQIQ